MTENAAHLRSASDDVGTAPLALLLGGEGPRRYAFARGLDSAAIVETSENVAWTIDEVFRGRRFDTSGTIVPAAWVGSATLSFLDDRDHVTLNHCRAFSYVHLLRNFEEFVPAHLIDVARHDWHDERARVRALFRFAEEELKHQELFRRAEDGLEESCGHSFGRYFDQEKRRVTEFSNALLEYPALPRFLILLALEWGTQRHYVESVRDQTAERGEPLYAEILKAHWIEEAQHTKCDMLEIASLAAEMSPVELDFAFDDLAAIEHLVDTVFVGQVDKEVETLEHVSGRRLPNLERAVLRETLCRSLSGMVAGSGWTHPRFTQVAVELSSEGAAKLGITPAPKPEPAPSGRAG